MRLEFAVLGHIAIDHVLTSDGCRIQLGGPPTYASLVARRLGVAVRAVTRLGEDMPEDLKDQLRELGIDPEGHVSRGSRTTRFVLDYRGRGRRLSVLSVCEEIDEAEASGLPETVLISPVIGEVPEGALRAVMERDLALDPQGFTRSIGPGGIILPRSWRDEGLLGHVKIFKSSIEELGLITGEGNPWRGLEKIHGLGVEAAMATMGEGGTLLLTGGRRYLVPPYRVERVVDPTGAGDAFISGYLSQHLRGEDALWCSSMGASAASAVIETLGARLEASDRQLFERAEEVYENILRL
jgi:sugar/nucleoside kinase (ribokinase family)